MKKSTDSEPATAVDAFLESVGRCLAQRWLELQRAGPQGETPSDHRITQPTVDQPSESKNEDETHAKRH